MCHVTTLNDVLSVFLKYLHFQLQNWVAEERNKGDLGEKLAVFPPHDEVYEWTQYCDIQDVSLNQWPML